MSKPSWTGSTEHPDADEARERLLTDALARPGVATALDVYTRAAASLPQFQYRQPQLKSWTGANQTLQSK